MTIIKGITGSAVLLAALSLPLHAAEPENGRACPDRHSGTRI